MVNWQAYFKENCTIENQNVPFASDSTMYQKVLNGLKKVYEK